MEITLYGYFGKGNLGDEALAEVWRRALSAFGGVRAMSPPRLPRGKAVVFAGEPLQDRTSRRSFLFYSVAIRAASRRGRAILGAVGVDLRPGCRYVLPWVLGDVDYVSVRDPRSREILASLGIPAAETRDPALLLDPPPGNHRGPVLVNLVPSLARGIRREALGFASTAARSLGKRLLGLVMARGEDERALVGVEPVTPRSPREALEVIGDAALVVGARLHALEFSLVCGTPFVAVPYAPKVDSFLKLLERDLPAGVPRIPGARVPEALDVLFSSGYWAALRRARGRLRAEAEEGVKDVVRFLRQDP